jgi:hypothetical protein
MKDYWEPACDLRVHVALPVVLAGDESFGRPGASRKSFPAGYCSGLDDYEVEV